MFLGKYKLMLAADSSRIYKAKYYHWKRLKVLEKEGYIKRINRVYIKLDKKGTRLVKEFGYDYSFLCRSKEYMERLKEIAVIAGLTLDSSIDFVASWNMKGNIEFTQTSRKYLGRLTYQGRETLVYYISRDKQIAYIGQIINDIGKVIDCGSIIIFVDDLEILNKNQKFIFGKKSTVIIKQTSQNLNLMRKLDKIDLYQIAKENYKNEEILLADWNEADYMTEDREYIFIMPFIDTEKLYRINVFYNDNQNTDRQISIISLKENKEKIEQMLTNKTNIIEIDDWLGGAYIDEE